MAKNTRTTGAAPAKAASSVLGSSKSRSQRTRSATTGRVTKSTAASAPAQAPAPAAAASASDVLSQPPGAFAFPQAVLPAATVEAVRDTVSKVSVSLPDSVTRSIKEMVGPGRFSSYVAAALQRQIELDRLAAYVAEVEAGLGRPISDELMAEADAAWHGE